MGKDQINAYLKWTRAERLGAILLLSLSALCWFAVPVFEYLRPTPPPTDFTEFKKKIEAFKVEIIEDDEPYNKGYKDYSKQSNYNKPKPKKKPAVIIPFAFDPNTISEADLLVMGIPRNAINNLVKFRNKGAKFYKKTDFKKVYGITDEIFEKIASFIKLPNESKKKFESNKIPPPLKPEVVITPFPFDPNTISKSEIMRMGFKEKIATTIENYRNKGGTFRKKDDLGKIYGIKPEDFKKIEPFITIEQQETPEYKPTFANNRTPKKKTPPQPIDINHAVAEDWMRLKGIGNGYARLIISYREKLGGFYSINQVKETYGLPDSTFQVIEPFLKLDKSNEKININSITLDGLKSHPYLNYRQAKAIINYRSNHGEFSNAADVAAVRSLTPEDVEKLVPYLKVED